MLSDLLDNTIHYTQRWALSYHLILHCWVSIHSLFFGNRALFCPLFLFLSHTVFQGGETGDTSK